jgi:hypothetical protein
MRNIFTTTALLLAVFCSAQAPRKKAGSVLQAGIYKSAEARLASATCYTISTVTPSNLNVATAAPDPNTAGCDTVAGYVFGTNCYGDLEKAAFIPPGYYASVIQPSVSAIRATFFKQNTIGTGGTASVTANMIIYTGDMVNGPGTVIATATANLGQIVAAQGTNTPLFDFVYTFTSAVAIPTTGIFCSLVVPNMPGDTAVIANEDSSAVDMAYEKWNDNSWNSCNSSWSFNGNMAVMPVMCGATITAISANSGISKNILVMPNPSSGLVRISVSSPGSQRLAIKALDMTGREIKSLVHETQGHDVIPLNLHDLEPGMYFINISNGKDQMTQKLLIER